MTESEERIKKEEEKKEETPAACKVAKFEFFSDKDCYPEINARYGAS